MRRRFTLPLLLSIGSWHSGPLALISTTIPTVEASQVDDNLWMPASGLLTAHTINSAWMFPAFGQGEARVYNPQLGTLFPTSEEIRPPINADEIGTVRLFGRRVGAPEFTLADKLDVPGEVLEQTSDESKFNCMSISCMSLLSDRSSGSRESQNADEATSGEPKILVNVSTLFSDSENSHRVFYLSITTTSADSPELISPAFGVAPEAATHEIFFGLEDLDLLERDEPAVPAGDVSQSLTEPGSIPTESSIPKGLDQTTANDNNAPENTASISTEDSLTGLDTARPDSPEENKGDGGLPVGAIIGIAVGASVALVVIVVVFWLIRRRKRAAAAHHADASTPLATTFPNAAAGRSEEVMTEKEAGHLIAESPQGQVYTDHRPASSGGTAMATAGSVVGGAAEAAYAGGSSHQPYESHDTERQPLPQPQPQLPPPPREELARSDTSSPLANMMVARHLVDPDMTEDEIRRLEDEERELDREIQQASRRT